MQQTHELTSSSSELPPLLNGLFLFYDDPDNHDLVRNITVKSSLSPVSTKREAIYIPIQQNRNLPALDIPGYRYDRQHQSIDKYLDPQSSVLPPSHFTVEYQHIEKPNHYLIIHVYFNHSHEHDGEVRAKMIEKNPKKRTEKLVEYHLTTTMIKTILLHAKDAENLLFKLQMAHSKKIVALLNEIANYNQDLAEYCANISEPYQCISAIDTAKKCVARVQKLQRYGFR